MKKFAYYKIKDLCRKLFKWKEFIENINLIFKIENTNEDYHGQMDSTNFEK